MPGRGSARERRGRLGAGSEEAPGGTGRAKRGGGGSGVARSAVRTMAAAAAVGRAAALAGMSARPLGAAEPMSLGSLRGKVLLVVNVASL